jgi:hypothetical protein
LLLLKSNAFLRLSNAFAQRYFRVSDCPFGSQPQGRPALFLIQDCSLFKKTSQNRGENVRMLAVVTACGCWRLIWGWRFHAAHFFVLHYLEFESCVCGGCR